MSIWRHMALGAPTCRDVLRRHMALGALIYRDVLRRHVAAKGLSRVSVTYLMCSGVSVQKVFNIFLNEVSLCAYFVVSIKCKEIFASWCHTVSASELCYWRFLQFVEGKQCNVGPRCAVRCHSVCFAWTVETFAQSNEWSVCVSILGVYKGRSKSS